MIFSFNFGMQNYKKNIAKVQENARVNELIKGIKLK